jgi:hypothetical protein
MKSLWVFIGIMCLEISTHCMHSSTKENAFQVYKDQELACYIKNHNYEKVLENINNRQNYIIFNNNITVNNIFWLLLSAVENRDLNIIMSILDKNNYNINPLCLVLHSQEDDLKCKETEFSVADFGYINNIYNNLGNIDNFLNALIKTNPNRIFSHAIKYNLFGVMQKLIIILKSDSDLLSRFDAMSAFHELLKIMPSPRHYLFLLQENLFLEKASKEDIALFYLQSLEQNLIDWPLVTNVKCYTPGDCDSALEKYKLNFDKLFIMAVTHNYFNIINNIISKNNILITQGIILEALAKINSEEMLGKLISSNHIVNLLSYKDIKHLCGFFYNKSALFNMPAWRSLCKEKLERENEELKHIYNKKLEVISTNCAIL